MNIRSIFYSTALSLSFAMSAAAFLKSGILTPLENSTPNQPEKLFRATVALSSHFSYGSGFLFGQVNNTTYIATAAHVVANEGSFDVAFNNNYNYSLAASSHIRWIPAVVVGTDQKNDIAVLRVNTNQVPKGVIPLTFDDSPTLRLGDQVYEAGNPFFDGVSVTAGIVSAFNKKLNKINHLIQFDAPTNQGNSGGPLANKNGEVIGVTIELFSGETGQNSGIAFAVPAHTAKASINQIIKRAGLKAPNLGS